jgi:hypothetical protein
MRCPWEPRDGRGLQPGKAGRRARPAMSTRGRPPPAAACNDDTRPDRTYRLPKGKPRAIGKSASRRPTVTSYSSSWRGWPCSSSWPPRASARGAAALAPGRADQRDVEGGSPCGGDLRRRPEANGPCRRSGCPPVRVFCGDAPEAGGVRRPLLRVPFRLDYPTSCNSTPRGVIPLCRLRGSSATCGCA